MNKILKRTLSVLCAGTMLLTIGACAENQTTNAYDIAVKNGFEGTEEAWLESLKGKDGKDGESLDINEIYQTLKTQGYEGDFSDFLKEYLSVEYNENNDLETIAKNTTSIVAICCGFYTTTSSSGGWFTDPVDVPSASAGTGVILDIDKTTGDATIVTNYHVVYSYGSSGDRSISQNIYVYPYGARMMFYKGDKDSNRDGKVDKADQGDIGGDGIQATFIGGAMDYDIALLKVRGSEYLKNSVATSAVIGNSEEVSVGEKVYAIGNSNGGGISVSNGVLSIDSKSISLTAPDKEGEITYRVMQTTAAINHGNSGGGLFNTKGELIGITNAKSVEEDTDNMGYALPISQVEKVVDNIIENGGVVKRPLLGIMNTISQSYAQYDANGKLRIIEEITVSDVSSGEPAFGILWAGDVIKAIAINGAKTVVTRRHQLNDILLTARVGDTVTLTIDRAVDGSKDKEVSITLKAEDFDVFA